MIAAQEALAALGGVVAWAALNDAHVGEHPAAGDRPEYPAGQSEFSFSHDVREIVRHAMFAVVAGQFDNNAIPAMNGHERRS